MEQGTWGTNSDLTLSLSDVVATKNPFIGTFIYELPGKLFLFDNGPLGILFHLGCAVVCLWIAHSKKRSLPSWGIFGLLFHAIAVFIILALKEYKPRKRRAQHPPEDGIEEAGAITSALKNDSGEFQVSFADLAGAQKMKPEKYVLKSKKAKKVEKPESPAEPDPALIAPAGEDKLSQLTDIVAGGSFKVDKKDKPLVEKAVDLLNHKLINKDEFVKAVAAVAYNDGKNLPSIEKKDAFGSPTYESDEHREAAKIVKDFFEEHGLAKEKVESLYTRKSGDLSKKAILKK